MQKLIENQGEISWTEFKREELNQILIEQWFFDKIEDILSK